MARRNRVIVDGYPHHVIQRGNRRQPVFFNASDYEFYKELVKEWGQRCEVKIWAYCLMKNHVHLMAVPKKAEGLPRLFKEVHSRYTRRINFREGWRGCLWQGRYRCYVMDERHMLAAARYIEMNPVKARMVGDPQAYPWSSAKAHIEGRSDGLVEVKALLKWESRWEAFLGATKENESDRIRACLQSGLPLGDDRFIDGLEKKLGRCLRRIKPGRRPRIESGN